MCNRENIWKYNEKLPFTYKKYVSPNPQQLKQKETDFKQDKHENHSADEEQRVPSQAQERRMTNSQVSSWSVLLGQEQR